MADLALCDSLIDEYLNYKFQSSYNQNTIRKLFKYIQPFSIRDDNCWMEDPSFAPQLENDPMIETIASCSDQSLVQNTLLKFMLTETTTLSLPYKILNINDNFEKLKPKYGATYTSSLDKSKAIEHIKYLLLDAGWVIVTDGYISTSRQWSNNKATLSSIIPIRQMNVKIIGGDRNNGNSTISTAQKTELEQVSSNNWNVQVSSIPNNCHDRYIETDKLKILLSSGLEHMSITSNKDFTYIVEIL